jgi:hypothetical protein
MLALPREVQDKICAAILWFIVRLPIIAAFVVPFSVGLSFLVTALAYKHTYIGTLVHSHVTKERGARGTYWFSVVEDFSRGSSSTTCAVKRMREYSESEANHAVSKTVIGSQRRIWEYWNRASHCYDQDIRNYNLAVGITVLAFSFFLLGFALWFYIQLRNYESTGSVPRNPEPVYTSVEMTMGKEDTGISRV